MRGKVQVFSGKMLRTGITPAYAGKRIEIRIVRSCFWDHPRLCGEKQYRRSSDCFLQGSPPPMRGKGILRKKLRRSRRITPAYAGKSPSAATFSRGCRDHPRLCGEKQNFSGELHLCFGITPAYAGKSQSDFPESRSPWDHPRLCGEKTAC